MRSAIGFVCLGSTSSIYPDTDGGGLSPGRVFCRDLNINQPGLTPPVVRHTVKPLLRVVHSVFAPWLTGVAKDRVMLEGP